MANPEQLSLDQGAQSKKKRSRRLVKPSTELAQQETPPKKTRGRPRKPPPDFVEPIPAGAKIEHLRIADLDLDDETFMFRAALRTGELKASILKHGQQMPIVVMGRSPGQKKFQVISGFRRATAIQEIGWETVAAIIRTDLDNEAAFRASVLENTARKTYTDLDKAHVMKRLQEQGMGSEQVAALMGLKLRQKNNIVSLLKMPKIVQDELAKDSDTFTTTHALLLRQMAGRHPDLEYGRWIGLCHRDALSIAQLKRAITAHYRSQERPGFETIFNHNASDWDKGEIRLLPLKLSVAALADDERERLRNELERLLARLDAA